MTEPSRPTRRYTHLNVVLACIMSFWLGFFTYYFLEKLGVL